MLYYPALHMTAHPTDVPDAPTPYHAECDRSETRATPTLVESSIMFTRRPGEVQKQFFGVAPFGRLPVDFLETSGIVSNLFPRQPAFCWYDSRPIGGATVEIPIFRRQPISREQLDISKCRLEDRQTLSVSTPHRNRRVMGVKVRTPGGAKVEIFFGDVTFCL
jgi:hypothetical protein